MLNTIMLNTTDAMKATEKNVGDVIALRYAKHSFWHKDRERTGTVARVLKTRLEVEIANGDDKLTLVVSRRTGRVIDARGTNYAGAFIGRGKYAGYWHAVFA